MVQHLKQIPLDSYRPLRDVVVDNLRQAIVSGQFPAGMRLNCSWQKRWESAGLRCGKPSGRWNWRAWW